VRFQTKAGLKSKQKSQRPRTADSVERRLRALNRALDCNHPTADIEEMLADIERGRDLR